MKSPVKIQATEIIVHDVGVIWDERSPFIDGYKTAFFSATGLLLSVHTSTARKLSDVPQNSLCRALSCSGMTCTGCPQLPAPCYQATPENSLPRIINCFGGLSCFVTTISLNGRPWATMMAGPVFSRQPAQADFERSIAPILQELGTLRTSAVRAAYLDCQILAPGQFNLVIKLMYDLKSHIVERGGVAATTSNNEPRVIARAKLFVEQHIEDAITPGDVLRHVHMSRSHFYRIFKQVTGGRLSPYIAGVRLAKARALLSDKNLGIAEIAMKTGFGSVSQFNSLFKRRFGMCPSVCRKAENDHSQ